MNIQKQFSEIIFLIKEARHKAFRAINQELIDLYWEIGKYITERTQIEGWGKSTVGQLAQFIQSQEPDLKGFSDKNLWRMKQFYETYKDNEKLSSLLRELSWTHNLAIIAKCKREEEREFYLKLAINEKLSVRDLERQINSMLYERTAISKKSDSTIRNDLAVLNEHNQMSTDLFLRDPYIFDFLGLKDSFSEKDLENTILLELEKFILEFGSDFAFLSRQKRIQIGGNDYYIDLLFYHRKLKRLVVIELKIGEFIPEYKGQVELYLKWLSKHEKMADEQEPIAIILCSGKDQEIIELMDLEKDNIHISEYWLKLPSKEKLQEKLHKAVESAKSKIEAKEIKELD
jgi:predicted nuclease of restriction endonuclease-like (RecB) superfamily